MKSILQTISFLLVRYIYKWIFPIAITTLMFFFADKERSLLIRFLLWLFLCIAYLSIPINFERPKRETYSYFLNRNFISIFVSTVLAFTLGLGVFVTTILSIVMYFPQIENLSILISTLNGLLYMVSIFLEFWLLPIKLQTQPLENKA